MALFEAIVASTGFLAVAMFAGVYGLRKTRHDRDFSAQADRLGWDHRTAVPEVALADVPSWIVPPSARAARYLSGPARTGAFRLIGFERPDRTHGIGRVPGALLAVATERSSPGLRLVPQPRFRLHGPSGDAWSGDARFVARYRVEAEDPAFAPRVLRPEARALLVQPTRSVRLDWTGRLLCIWFPVGLDTPETARTLLRYGEALAARLEAAPRWTGSRRIATPEPHPVVTHA